MSYNKNTESMLSFILPTVIKQELEEYCSVTDRTQSQVLRESVYEYLRYVRESYMGKQVGQFDRNYYDNDTEQRHLNKPR